MVADLLVTDFGGAEVPVECFAQNWVQWLLDDDDVVDAGGEHGDDSLELFDVVLFLGGGLEDRGDEGHTFGHSKVRSGGLLLQVSERLEQENRQVEPS